MAGSVLLPHDISPKDHISMQKSYKSISKKTAKIISVASDEYCDSDEDIYGNSTDSDEVELSHHYNAMIGTASSYSQLKNYAEIEMEENAKLNKYYKQLILYIIYNSLRFLLIGIIVLMVNIKHENDIQNFKNGNNNMACCYCYNYAKFQSPTYRIDWSMCYDVCDQCKSCQNINETNSECKMPQRDMNYINNIRNENESCPEKLSNTSFGYFVKNYLYYGIGALVCVILYIIFMISAVCIGGARIISSGVMFIFVNVQLSLICAYCITKPYQYYLETYSYGTVEFECYKDSLNEDLEHILTLLVDCAVAFITLPFVLCCCRCIAFRRDSYRIRKIYATVMKIILVLAVLGCGLGTIALTWISFKVAKKHEKESGNTNLFHNATMLIIVMDLFMVLSAFDICIFCQFCRHKINTIYMVRYSPYVTHRDWELTVSENKSMQTTSNYPN